jgi:hypothetical protein
MRSQLRTRAGAEAGRVRRYARAAHAQSETRSEPQGLKDCPGGILVQLSLSTMSKLDDRLEGVKHLPRLLAKKFQILQVSHAPAHQW